MATAAPLLERSPNEPAHFSYKCFDEGVAPAERLERFYRMFPWVEDPFSPVGRARYETGSQLLQAATRARVVEGAAGREASSTCLDICGGTGVGGVALAKALAERGVKGAIDRVRPARKRAQGSREVQRGGAGLAGQDG
jgi:hypothetical protein